MKLKRFIVKTRGAISAGVIVAMVVGFWIFAILGRVALTALESYTPTDPTNAVAWALAGTLFIIGIAMRYIPRGK